jgi:hypothetical protein
MIFHIQKNPQKLKKCVKKTINKVQVKVFNNFNHNKTNNINQLLCNKNN